MTLVIVYSYMTTGCDGSFFCSAVVGNLQPVLPRCPCGHVKDNCSKRGSRHNPVAPLSQNAANFGSPLCWLHCLVPGRCRGVLHAFSYWRQWGSSLRLSLTLGCAVPAQVVVLVPMVGALVPRLLRAPLERVVLRGHLAGGCPCAWFSCGLSTTAAVACKTALLGWVRAFWAPCNCMPSPCAPTTPVDPKR